MNHKYILFILFVGIVFGYILCLCSNNKNITKNVSITNPAAW